MFTCGSDGVYRSDRLSTLPWLEHGFGTRNSPAWPGDYTHLKQIHSHTVVLAKDARASLLEGDALITQAPGHFVGIRTADCVPLLIADRRLRAVAAVHAGWRGTAANIAESAVRKMGDAFGSRPRDLLVAIGPCISNCCYEVGPEVAAHFEPYLPGASSMATIDLAEINRRQFLTAGIESGNIDTCGLCTACVPAEFHSWRRDRHAAGRMVAAIAIR